MNNKGVLKINEVVAIVVITCIFSVFAGISYGKIKYSGVTNAISNDSSDTDALNNFIRQYNYIRTNYYDSSKIDDSEMMKIALEGILSELGLEDSYSLYMEDDTYSQLNINLEGSYEGLGISVYKDDETGNMVIVKIMDNVPVSNVDLHENDLILAIDGKSVKDMSTQEFSQYVLKSKEKNFLLKVSHNDELKNVTVQKKKIELDSVTSKIINKNDRKIGYISISIFASNTYTQFKNQLQNLENENIDSLIIDLRNNTGGHLAEVNKIISLFVSKEKVVYQLEKDDKKIKYYSKGTKDKTYPIVFLGNEVTASASEVFIISLKENLGAKLVGTKSYGKGTVQELIKMSNGDQYKFTTKKWLSPNGLWINDTNGIQPDVSVQLSDEYYLESTEENDNQLSEAINLSIEKK